MPDRVPTLTATNIRYLLALYELDRDERGARGSEIAERLGVTKPSVHTMMKTLSDRKYITKKDRGVIHLTPCGRRLAARYTACFEALYANIQSALRIPAQECRNAVCAILAQFRESDLDQLLEKTEGSADAMP